jgi:hypothetical protein
MCIFALLGMQVFGARFYYNPLTEKPRGNFDSFYQSLLTVFQVNGSATYPPFYCFRFSVAFLRLIYTADFGVRFCGAFSRSVKFPRSWKTHWTWIFHSDAF